MDANFWSDMLSLLPMCFLVVAVGLIFVFERAITWWRLRKAQRAYEFVPPWEPTGKSEEERKYAGEVLPHQRQLVLALYRHMSGDLTVDTRKFGYRQQKPGTGEWETVPMGDQVFPLQQDLCTAIRRLGWDRMVESVVPQLKVHLDVRLTEVESTPTPLGSRIYGTAYNSDWVEFAAKSTYEAHEAAIAKLVAENPAIKLDAMNSVYGLGPRITNLPAIRAFSPKYEQSP